MGETAEGETGSCSDGWGYAQQIFNPIFCWWSGWCSFLLFDLRPTYGGSNEDHDDLLQKVPCRPCCTQGLGLCSSPPLTHASAGDTWMLLGRSESVPLVGSLLLSPGSWDAQGFVCALQESVSPVLSKFWWLCGGVNGDLLQEDLCLLYPEPLPLCQATEDL